MIVCTRLPADTIPKTNPLYSMKKTKAIIAVMAMLFTLTAAAQRKMCFDRDWHFRLGDAKAVVTNPKMAEQWRLLDLPHDWSVEPEAARQAGGNVIGPFSSNSTGGYQTAFTVGGEGWYCKTLTLSRKQLKADRHVLYFEGAYNQAEVYVNGSKLYFNHYGYIGFRVDITDSLNEGDNSICVRVTNEGNNSRWYAGSGIFRHVWLITTPREAYLDEWDLAATSHDNSDGTWTLTVTAPFHVQGKKAVVRHTLYDSKGRLIATTDGKAQTLTLTINNPLLWSPEEPNLYRLVTQLIVGRKTKDELNTRIGFRSLKYSATEGFLLNGKPTLLRGGCVHHDNGLLGAAAFDRAEQRKLELLKAQGYNAVRTSHGLPAEHFLDMCDSLGLMVVDETFDQWLLEKNHEDYHRYFTTHSTADLQTMIRRDRNHPSIVMWSIGNEIPGRIEPEGMAAAERLRQTILQLDNTRPVTAAICGWDNGDTWNSAGHSWEQQDNKAFQSLDIGGYNYLYFLYERDHGTHPERVICGLESYPKQMSQNWDIVERLPYVIGDFIWTAMDYLGEAGIGSAAFRTEGQQTMFQDWPWFNGWCGDIDITGQKKPQSYYHDVVWRRIPIAMAAERQAPEGQHQSVSAWGWQLESQTWEAPTSGTATYNVNVYSRAPKVRLYLNGQNLGDKQPGNTYWTAYNVPFAPGTLRAVNLDDNGNEKPGEDFILQTAGEPAALRLTADRTDICRGRADLAYVTIELVDAEGHLCTTHDDMKVNISAEGEGGILFAAGNASPTDMESFRSTTPRLFNGRALAILRSSDKPAPLHLNVSAPGLPTATLTINCR